MAPGDVKGPDAVMVTDAVPEVPQPGDRFAHERLVTARSVGEPAGEIGPQCDVPLGHKLVPEAERDLRDDLSGVGRLPVDTHATHGLGNIPVGLVVLAGATRIAAKFSGVIEDPVARPTQCTVPSGHS